MIAQQDTHIKKRRKDKTEKQLNDPVFAEMQEIRFIWDGFYGVIFHAQVCLFAHNFLSLSNKKQLILMAPARGLAGWPKK